MTAGAPAKTLRFFRDHAGPSQDPYCPLSARETTRSWEHEATRSWEHEATRSWEHETTRSWEPETTRSWSRRSDHPGEALAETGALRGGSRPSVSNAPRTEQQPRLAGAGTSRTRPKNALCGELRSSGSPPPAPRAFSDDLRPPKSRRARGGRGGYTAHSSTRSCFNDGEARLLRCTAWLRGAERRAPRSARSFQRAHPS
jgi:hypothetical protein